jgi:integrase/recombinase XerD
MSPLAPTLQGFFTTYLTGQKGASAHTITAYRDTWRLLLTYLREEHHRRPADIDFTDLNAETITRFLTYLQTTRHNSAVTRNARLAAIHALFHYAAYLHPEHADLIKRVLAIAPKAAPRTPISYLTDVEVTALLAAPPAQRWAGRRDRLIILTLVTTGLRVSELTQLTWPDVQLSRPAHVLCHGKGRKDRITPLNPTTATSLHAWLRENHATTPAGPVFTAQGTTRAMTTDAVAQRLHVHARLAAATCPTLASKNITPHVLRHTTAMRMLAAGIDVATISLWFGHESIDSTKAYLHADMSIKQRALERTAPPRTSPGRYRPPDVLLHFLENL